MKNCFLGRILHHIDGKYGFDVAFKTAKEARHYKDMFTFIIKSDHYKVEGKVGPYDKGEK